MAISLTICGHHASITRFIAPRLHVQCITIFFVINQNNIISVCGNTMCLISTIAKLRYRFRKEPITAQLVSRLSLSEIMVQGGTNIGQLVSQLSLSEKYGSGRTMGTSRVLLYISISVYSKTVNFKAVVICMYFIYQLNAYQNLSPMWEFFACLHLLYM